MVRRTDRPAMTIAVDLGRKATKQTTKQNEIMNTSGLRICTGLTANTKLLPILTRSLVAEARAEVENLFSN